MTADTELIYYGLLPVPALFCSVPIDQYIPGILYQERNDLDLYLALYIVLLFELNNTSPL